jgi:hypothetical protein
MKRTKCQLYAIVPAVLLLTLLTAPLALAQVKPGDVITPDNAYKVKDLVSPGVFYKVQQGMSMKIAPSQRVDWPPPYKDATEKYSEQVRLSPDGRTVENYVAGQPFPFLDPNDPKVATKIIWNNVFRPLQTDDYDLRYFACENVRSGRNAPYRVLDEIDVGSLRRLQRDRTDRGRANAGRSRLQEDRALLAVRALSDHVAGRYARSRLSALPLRRSEKGR